MHWEEFFMFYFIYIDSCTIWARGYLQSFQTKHLYFQGMLLDCKKLCWYSGSFFKLLSRFSNLQISTALTSYSKPQMPAMSILLGTITNRIKSLQWLIFVAAAQKLFLLPNSLLINKSQSVSSVRSRNFVGKWKEIQLSLFER